MASPLARLGAATVVNKDLQRARRQQVHRMRRAIASETLRANSVLTMRPPPVARYKPPPSCATLLMISESVSVNVLLINNAPPSPPLPLSRKVL